MTQHDAIKKATQRAVEHGHPDTVAAFAGHLVDLGMLGAGVANMSADMRVSDLVDAYVRSFEGMATLSDWAKDVAADAVEQAEEDRAEAMASA